MGHIPWGQRDFKVVKLSFKETWFYIPGGSVAKNPPANTGDSGSNSGQEDPLEMELANAWKILCTV